MANVAFILADLYPDSEFIKPWQRARDAGYQTSVVGLRHGVDLERNVGADWVAGGGRGRNLITSRTPADLRPFCDALLEQLMWRSAPGDSWSASTKNTTPDGPAATAPVHPR